MGAEQSFPPGGPDSRVEVTPVVVLSNTFPARPSSIPEIREYVRTCLAGSPLAESDNAAVSQTVFRALLDAAGPTGTIQISCRIFLEHVEIDVLHSNPKASAEPTQATQEPAAAPATFADWMSKVLSRDGLTKEQAATQLGVSVRTVDRWLGGRTEPRMRDLRRIRERFGGTGMP